LLKFFLQRVALTVPTFVALMFVTFVAIRLVPGDPVEVRVGERGISPERLAYFRHELGLDQPVWKQFLDYVWHLLHGDFGTSLVTNQKVLTEFAALFPATIELGVAGMLIAVLLGIPAGAMAAVKRGTWYDQLIMGLSVTGYSMPIFWWGLILIMVVAEGWGLTPVSGASTSSTTTSSRRRASCWSMRGCRSNPALSWTPCATSSCPRSCSAPSRSR
jgi:dipeptide transport system permease protein